MKERPMIPKLLSGRKTMFRKVVGTQPVISEGCIINEAVRWQTYPQDLRICLVPCSWWRRLWDAVLLRKWRTNRRIRKFMPLIIARNRRANDWIMAAIIYPVRTRAVFEEMKRQGRVSF